MGLHLFEFKHKKHWHIQKNQSVVKDGFFTPGMLIAACFLLYTSMMAAKGVFLAEINYLMKEFAVDKATASLTNTYYFVAYAGAQVLLFFFIKKLDIKKFLLVTVPVSAVATVLMGFARGITDMYFLFTLCGVFQAGVYAGCNYTLTSYLPQNYLSKANSVMNFGYATGTVITYVFCAICVKMTAWRIPFYVMGGILLASAVCYFICARKCAALGWNKGVGTSSGALRTENEAFLKVGHGGRKTLFYSVDLVLTFLTTALYYAIMNWISTLLVEVYNVSQDVSLYITVLAPALIALGPIMTIRFCDKERDFIKVGIVFMATALPIPLLLAFFYNVNVIVAFVLSVAFVVVINGVKAISLSVMAFKLRDEVNTAEYSVIVNATASLAGGVAPTAVGKIIDSFGWSASYFAIFAVALVVTLSMIVADTLVKNAKLKKGQARCLVTK